MKKPDITEGEWKYFGSLEKTDLTGEICRIGISYSVMSDGDVSETAEADAKAISAVPEMIDALIEIKDTYRNPEKGNMVINKAKWIKIEQALKKAGCHD